MKMVTRIAFDNMKYHKSKNILIGVAIFLTTLLLFVVPTVGKDLIDAEYAAVNEYYPQFHAYYKDVDAGTVKELSAHHDIGNFGLRSNVGQLFMEDFGLGGLSVSMLYLDEKAMELSKEELAAGRLPEQENEIAVTEGLLEMLGLKADVGDTITLPCQILRGGELDYREDKEFVVTGFLSETERSVGSSVYKVIVSEDFLRAEVPEDKVTYDFMFQISDVEHATTDGVEADINRIAEQFSISQSRVILNTSYLGANYVDPAMFQIILVIMVIIVIAGIISVYSIYYVSMTQRVQEFGRLKALGAARKQIKQIVLREGLLVAVCAIPLGLLVGTIVTRLVLVLFTGTIEIGNYNVSLIEEEILNKISLYHGWIYLLTAGVTLFTVYLSLLKPMRMAGKISVVETLRFQGTIKRKKKRKGYEYISISRLAGNNIITDKKKGIITVLAMSMTGIFIMVVATVLSCTSPEQMTNEGFIGQYMIEVSTMSGNKEHPELEWSAVQKDNPLNDSLKEQVMALDGVERIEEVSYLEFTLPDFSEIEEEAMGVPEDYATKLEDGIIEGNVTYEELVAGDKLILNKNMKYWYPELNFSIGDKITFLIDNDGEAYEKEMKIAAIGDYQGIYSYAGFLMAKQTVDSTSQNNLNHDFILYADKDYDEELFNHLYDLIEDSGRLILSSWKWVYESNKSFMAITNIACIVFLGILSVICITNLINTMINSVTIRRKELGILQAIGMSDKQLRNMLMMEGLIYTAGTLVISLGVGSILGYAAFLWAKEETLFNIKTLHYPFMIAGVLIIVLVCVQILLVLVLSKSIKRESMIERIRFEN